MITGLSPRARFAKRSLDLAISIPAAAVTLPLVLVLIAVAAIDTRRAGVFVQRRIGRHGVPFSLYKIRTMRDSSKMTTTVTTANDARITPLGGWLRRLKLDELPQLWNVVLGDMSLVGPRPDVAGFADLLRGDDRVVLSVRPGITGPATLAFRREEQMLASEADPERYNREVIWPRKVELNKAYVLQYRFWMDLVYVWCTVTGRSLAPLHEHAGTQTST